MLGISGFSTALTSGLRLSLLFGTALTLAACDENGQPLFGAGGGEVSRDGGDTPATQSVQLVERDVEAPDVFQTTDAGLWDGRPSLGGVWVAHPDVTEPERVIIRNQDTGAFVIGALFRRERDNPGPVIQVSSDTAAALEMLAGAPAQLQVTALRRETVTEPEPTATSDFGAPVDVAATPLDEAPVAETADPLAVAAAAIDAAEATAPVATTVPAPRPVSAPASNPSNLEKPYIQIGIFSVEDNATRTADGMRANGIVPTVLQQQSQGRTFWRVIVGPTSSESERADLLQIVRGQGFEDAYFVTD